jgi:LysM repeat protein
MFASPNKSIRNMAAAWSAGKNSGNNKLLYLAGGLFLLLILLIALGPGENAGIGQLLSAAAPDSSSFVPDSSEAIRVQEEKTYAEFPERTAEDSARSEPVVTTAETSGNTDSVGIAETSSKPVEAQPQAEAGGSILNYKIRKGDTFFKIAAMFGNKPADLQELNNMEDMNLQADKAMKVRIKAMHPVAQGEGINAVAEKYGVSARSIKIANGLSSDNIPSGTTLIIPLK